MTALAVAPAILAALPYLLVLGACLLGAFLVLWTAAR